MSKNRIVMGARELLEHLDDSTWVVVDCRSELADPHAGRRDYEAAHISGAIFLDLDEDLAGPIAEGTGRHPLPDPDVVAAKIGGLGIGKSQHVLVYDGGPGALAARAWWILRWLGHDSVHLLDGGFGMWRSLGLPVNEGIDKRAATNFEPRLREDLVLGTKELADNVATIAGYNLLDARDAARFRGEVEPIDPVAGHIPGAMNLPYTDFVREDGTWLPIDERTMLLERAIGSDKSVDWSVMCGSGVTACHLAISGVEAGYREPRLYVGSWSEWICDPQRPVATSDT